MKNRYGIVFLDPCYHRDVSIKYIQSNIKNKYMLLYNIRFARKTRFFFIIYLPTL